MEPTAKPIVALIGCGGTISSLGSNPLDTTNYRLGAKLRVAELLERFPEASEYAEIIPMDFSSVGSSAFGPPEWFDLRALILGLAKKEIDGCVILHGTATLEETAFFLHLTLALSFPVILVGAQRPASAVSSDAGMNLISAVRVAASSKFPAGGVFVVMNDEIHSARDAVKTSNHRLQTFQSPNSGPVGQIDGDGVKIYRFIAGHNGLLAESMNGRRAADLPRVEIIYSYAGSDGALIDAAVSAGARGIVSAGLAPGVATPGELQAYRRAAANGVVIVQCSRAHSGRVVSGRYTNDEAIIPADNLTPQKARIFLSLCLLEGCSALQVAQRFGAC